MTKTEMIRRAQQAQPWDRKTVLSSPIALDFETTLIDEDHPDQTPNYVLGAAADMHQCVFITPTRIAEFIQAHLKADFVFHHAAFDLKVLATVCGRDAIDELVEQQRVKDTMLMKRLLGLAAFGSSEQDRCSLSVCVEEVL